MPEDWIRDVIVLAVRTVRKRLSREGDPVNTSEGVAAARKETPMKKNNSGGRRIAEQTDERSADLRVKIAEAAYYRAERRGFIGGDPVEDWLAAESELLSAAPEHRDEAEVSD